MNAALVAALIVVESGGNDLAIGDGGRARGALQIHAAVVEDVNRHHGTRYTHAEMHDRAKAVRVASLYLATYAPGATPEVQARTWNGGAEGGDQGCDAGILGARAAPDGRCAMSPNEFCNLTNPCPEDREWAVANCRDMDEAWATARPGWLVWIATRPGVLHNRTLRRFAVWSARQVQHLMTDPRSLAALDVAERHADGLATDEELAAARDAAWAAALAAARDAAWAAALAAARDAARAAAYDAAEVAAWNAAWAAAGAAARTASWAAQGAWLRANAKPDWERARKMGGAR